MKPSSTILRSALVLAALALLIYARGIRPEREGSGDAGTPGAAADAAVVEAFQNRQSGHWLEAHGVVDRLLADDERGARHQRFILRLDNDHTLLISHNIDLAPRIPAATGDAVWVRGRYEWNERGGLIHWTHHDPAGRRAGGWIRHGERLYE